MTIAKADFFRSFRLAAPLCVLLGAAALPGQALTTTGDSGTVAQPDRDARREARRKRAERRLDRNAPAQERKAEDYDPSELPPVDPELVDWFQRVNVFLADPAREGRAPGTHGIEVAADYLENELQQLGLEPAFADGTSYRQEMVMGRSYQAAREILRIGGRTMTPGEDFRALAYSSSSSASGSAVFTGYAIDSGPKGYTGFNDDDLDSDLNGAIAICLKYEPMDENGVSIWREDGWSVRARMTYKIRELERRGAGAVLIVPTPGAADERAGELDTMESTAPPQVMTGGAAPSVEFDIPVLSISAQAAERIIRESGAGTTLSELIKRANSGPAIVELPGVEIETEVLIESAPTLTDNLGAILPGRGALADELVVIGAHYDHVGYGRFGSRIRNAAGIVHPGADDNGSGTAALLIAAAQLRDRYALLGETDNARSILFLYFTAEESGLNGSKFYVENPIDDLEDHEIMLNLDMVGGLDADPLEVGGLESSDRLEALALRHLEDSGVLFAQDTSVGSGRSDHASFEAVEIPNLFFFTGLHERYHTPADTSEFIDNEGAVRVATICAQIAYDAAIDTEGFPHERDGQDNPTRNAPTVRVGIVPSNAIGGGMTVLRVFDGTSADLAGIKPNDIITHWDGQAIESVESWSPVLQEHEPGDVVELKVRRGDKELEIEMTLQGSP